MRSRVALSSSLGDVDPFAFPSCCLVRFSRHTFVDFSWTIGLALVGRHA